MKATGIIRKIDDLGRIVIPKEIRRSMHIREGDPLEIYTSRDGEVIFKKYSLMEGIEDFAADLCEVLHHSTGFLCAAADRDSVVAAAGGGKRDLLGRHISPALEHILEARRAYRAGETTQPVFASEDSERFLIQVAVPILSQGDLLGGILLLSTEAAPAAGDAACQLAEAFAAFLGHHMES